MGSREVLSGFGGGEAVGHVDVARARAWQAGAWQNPTVGATASEWRPRESPSGAVGGFIEQVFTLGGKRPAERAVSSADVTIREAELQTAQLRVRFAVRVAYYEWSEAVERLGVAERLLAVAGDSVGIARQLMNVGMVDRPDVLEAEAEHARQRAALVVAQARRTGAWRRLVIASADPGLATPLVMALTGAAVPVLDREVSLNQVLSNSPHLKAAEAEMARERLAVDVERRRASPDLTLRADAAWNREQPFALGRSRALGWEFGAEAGFTVPLFNTNRGGVLAAGAAVTAAEIVSWSRISPTMMTFTSSRNAALSACGKSGASMRTSR